MRMFRLPPPPPPPLVLTAVRRLHGDVATISATVSMSETKPARTAVIRKNVFGHRWVLRVNDDDDAKKTPSARWRLVVYVVVFCCIVVAVCFGVYLSIDAGSEGSKAVDGVPEGSVEVSDVAKAPGTHEIATPTDKKLQPELSNKLLQPSAGFCSASCAPPNFVCLKRSEVASPRCMPALDRRDPTGCGGHCHVNTQYCKLLDATTTPPVYQCIDVRNVLVCRKNMFNCGNMCVPLGKRCDGIFHCSDYSDEKDCECNLTTHFHCGYTTSCLVNSKKCDGKIDCWDKSDERSCGQTVHADFDDYAELRGADHKVVYDDFVELHDDLIGFGDQGVRGVSSLA